MLVFSKATSILSKCARASSSLHHIEETSTDTECAEITPALDDERTTRPEKRAGETSPYAHLIFVDVSATPGTDTAASFSKKRKEFADDGKSVHSADKRALRKARKLEKHERRLRKKARQERRDAKQRAAQSPRKSTSRKTRRAIDAHDEESAASLHSTVAADTPMDSPAPTHDPPKTTPRTTSARLKSARTPSEPDYARRARFLWLSDQLPLSCRISHSLVPNETFFVDRVSPTLAKFEFSMDGVGFTSLPSLIKAFSERISGARPAYRTLASKCECLVNPTFDPHVEKVWAPISLIMQKC